MRSIARSFLIRKLLTRPIWWWEKHRKYPIRERVFALQPKHVNPNASTILAVLTTPNTICDAAWAAQSLLRYLPPEIGLSIVVDGALPATRIEHFKVLFPGVILFSTHTLLENMRTVIPKTARMGSYHPLGRKLAMVFYLQQKYNLLYSDADLLCFNKIPEISQAIVNSSLAWYLQDVAEVKTDPIVLKQVQNLNYDYASTINTGFLYIPRESLNLNMAEQILSNIENPLRSWFCETTILAVLMQQAKAKPLPKSRYVVSVQRQWYFEKDVLYDQIALRHFTTPVRHLMYSKGMPILWQDLQQKI
jgi:hypothetical protein